MGGAGALFRLCKGFATKLHPQPLGVFVFNCFVLVFHYVVQAGLELETLLPVFKC